MTSPTPHLCAPLLPQVPRHVAQAAPSRHAHSGARLGLCSLLGGRACMYQRAHCYAALWLLRCRPRTMYRLLMLGDATCLQLMIPAASSGPSALLCCCTPPASTCSRLPTLRPLPPWLLPLLQARCTCGATLTIQPTS